MKELKFRAWDQITKSFYETTLLSGASIISSTVSLGSNHLYETWEQFTGLKDKNGKEIYEGDIIRLWYDGEDQGLQAIEWDETGCCFTIRWDGFGDYDVTSIGWALGADSGFELEAEVIENVHQNPELLK